VWAPSSSLDSSPQYTPDLSSYGVATCKGMKVTNLTSGPIYLKDLRVIREGQSAARRAEDRYIGAGQSAYLPDTSDVIRSAQKGDLFAFAQAGKILLNDTITLPAFPGPGNDITLNHGLGYPPHTLIFKKVMVGPVVTWVDAFGTVDVVHNANFTAMTITNVVALPIDFLIRIG